MEAIRSLVSEHDSVVCEHGNADDQVQSDSSPLQLSKQEVPSPPYLVQVNQQFMDSLFNLLVMQTFDMDLLELAAECLFGTICCDQVPLWQFRMCLVSHLRLQAHFQDLANQLITGVSDAAAAQRVMQCFETLIGNELELRFQRVHKKRFTTNFSQFLVDVRSLIHRR